jgi:hypothetical protein
MRNNAAGCHQQKISSRTPGLFGEKIIRNEKKRKDKK